MYKTIIFQCFLLRPSPETLLIFFAKWTRFSSSAKELPFILLFLWFMSALRVQGFPVRGKQFVSIHNVSLYIAISWEHSSSYAGFSTWCRGFSTWCRGISTWCRGLSTWCRNAVLVLVGVVFSTWYTRYLVLGAVQRS